MNSILFLNHKYCTSLNDIKDVLSKIDNLESPLFHELRRAFQDGTLTAWLAEGSDTEKELAAKLGEMQPSVTNEIMLRQFNLLFADKDVVIHKPLYEEYFKLSSSRYRINDGEYHNSEDGFFIGNKKGKIEVALNFEILKTANLNYTITIVFKSENGKILQKASDLISLNSIGKTHTTRASLEVSVGTVSVYIDDKKIKAVEILGHPQPLFSPDCNEIQKKAINHFLSQMKFVEGTTDEFCIFDGNPHKTTLTGYYISPLINLNEYLFILSNERDYYLLNSPDLYIPAKATIDNIEMFIRKLKSLSSLPIDLPSEAQFLNALKTKAIKPLNESDGYEWMLDRRGDKAPETEINPVCITTTGQHVIRRDATTRTFALSVKNYFRLVLTL